MDETVRNYFRDIVFWGERLDRHLGEMGSEEFVVNHMISDAACWCLSCIGEAAGAIRRFSPEVAVAYPGLELARAYAMRNRLAHDYGGIDLGVVWQAATHSVPPLIEAARLALDGE